MWRLAIDEPKQPVRLGQIISGSSRGLCVCERAGQEWPIAALRSMDRPDDPLLPEEYKTDMGLRTLANFLRSTNGVKGKANIFCLAQ